MSWIKEIQKADSPTLAKIYEDAEKRTQEPTANVLKVHSLRPNVLQVHMSLYETIMFHEGPLTRTQREMIGVVVSKANQCPYCVGHHSEALQHVSQKNEHMEQVAIDYKEANLAPLDLAICDYAHKLTQTPFKMEEDDVTDLRQHGLSDEAIFDVNQIVAYFNYVNRIVHGLGVELE